MGRARRRRPFGGQRHLLLPDRYRFMVGHETNAEASLTARHGAYPQEGLSMRARSLILAVILTTTLPGPGAAMAGDVAAAPDAEITTATTQIAFQGFLQNGGIPVNGNVSITANLYSVPSGGTAMWTETQNPVAVTDGVFQVALGSVTPLVPSQFTGAPIYLGVSV